MGYIDYAIALPNVYQAQSGTDTPAGLIAAIVEVLESVGWTATGQAGQLLGVSPQGYTVYVKIWDDSTNLGYPSVSIQLSSTSSAAVGYEHYVAVGTGFPWQMCAHPCGFALSRMDLNANQHGTNVFAGIPRVPDKCGFGPQREIWFSFGDGGRNAFFSTGTPRTNLDIGTLFDFGSNQTGCINGVVYPLGGGANWSQPQIVRQSSEAADGAPQDSHPLWYNGADLFYPSLIAWGDAPSAVDVKIRGQVYNACNRSGSVARDITRYWDSMGWISFTDNYFFGTLWLVTSVGAEEICNVAY